MSKHSDKYNTKLTSTFFRDLIIIPISLFSIGLYIKFAVQFNKFWILGELNQAIKNNTIPDISKIVNYSVLVLVVFYILSFYLEERIVKKVKYRVYDESLSVYLKPYVWQIGLMRVAFVFLLVFAHSAMTLWIIDLSHGLLNIIAFILKIAYYFIFLLYPFIFLHGFSSLMGSVTRYERHYCNNCHYGGYEVFKYDSSKTTTADLGNKYATKEYREFKNNEHELQDTTTTTYKCINCGNIITKSYKGRKYGEFSK